MSDKGLDTVQLFKILAEPVKDLRDLGLVTGQTHTLCRIVQKGGRQVIQLTIQFFRGELLPAQIRSQCF